MPDFEIADQYDNSQVEARRQGFSPVSNVTSMADTMTSADVGSQLSAAQASGEQRIYKETASLAPAVASAINSKHRAEESLDAVRERNRQFSFQVAEENLKRRQDEMRHLLASNAMSHGGLNPEAEAQIRKIAEQTGFTVDSVRSNLANYQKGSLAKNLAAMAENYSRTGTIEFFSDANNLAIAHDDVPNITNFEDLLNYTADLLGRAPAAGLYEGTVGLATNTAGVAIHSIGQTNANAGSYIEQMADPSQYLVSQDEDVGGKQFQQNVEEFNRESVKSAHEYDKVYEDVKYTADQIAGERITNGRWHGWASGLVSGTRSMGAQAPAMLLGMLTGGATVPLALAGVSEGSNAFMEDMSKGRNYATAIGHGIWNGAVEVGTELLPMHYLFKDRALKTGILKTLGRNFALEMPTELVATTLQKLGDDAADFNDKDVNWVVSPDFWKKYGKELPSALWETAWSVLPMSLFSTGMTHRYQKKSAENMMKAYDALTDNVKASKLQGRSAEAHKMMVRTVAKNTKVEEVHYDREKWDSYFQGLDISPEQAAKDMGATYDANEEFVTMPTEEFTSKMIPAGHAEALRADATFNKDRRTWNQVIELEEQINRERAELKEDIDRLSEKNDEWRKVNDVTAEFEENLKHLLINVGKKTPKTASAEAQLNASFYTVPIIRNAMELAKEQGREATPEEIARSVRSLYKELGFNVTRGGLMVRKNVEPVLDSMIETLRSGTEEQSRRMNREAYGQSITEFVKANGKIAPTRDITKAVKDGRLPRSILRKGAVHGADTMAELAKQAGYDIDDVTAQGDDSLLMMLESEHAMGERHYSNQQYNGEKAVQIAALNDLSNDLWMAGIDLKNDSNEVIRQKLAEFDGDKYGREDSRAVPETEETGGQVESLYQFIGEKGAEAIDKANNATAMMESLDVARQMEKSGFNAKKIKLATGWERTASGKWSYEIPDMTIKDGFSLPKDFETTDRVGVTFKLSEMVNAEDLFKAYPDLKDVDVTIKHSDRDAGGWYDKANNMIVMQSGYALTSGFDNPDYVKLISRRDELRKTAQYEEFSRKIDALFDDFTEENYRKAEELSKAFDETDIGKEIKDVQERISNFGWGLGDWARGTLIHEVQHAIQAREGFAKGGNSANADAYKNIFWNETAKNRDANAKYKYAADYIFASEYLKQKERFEKNPNAFIKTSMWLQYGPAFGLPKDKADRSAVIQKAIDEWQKDVENSRDSLKYAIRHLNILNEEEKSTLLKQNREDMKKYLLGHEAFKNAQDVRALMDSLSDYDIYHHLAGEVQARNAERRMNMSLEARRNSLASDTEDVVRKDQILITQGYEAFNAINASERIGNTLEENRKIADEKLEAEIKVWESKVDEIKEDGFAKDRVVMLEHAPLSMILLGANFDKLYANPHLFDGISKKDKVTKRGGVHSNINETILKQIPRELTRPIAVFKSGRSYTYMLDIKDDNNSTVVVPVRFDIKEYKKGTTVAYLNVVTSGYSKDSTDLNGITTPRNDWFTQEEAKGNLVYIDTDKVKDWNSSIKKERQSNPSDASITLWSRKAAIPYLGSIKTQRNLVNLSEQPEYQTYYQSGDNHPRMMATHTLSAESLKFADGMGGLAVPSIAVTTEDAGDADFGEITLIGNRSMADPASNPVYSADAYTARFPRPVYKAGNKTVINRLYKELSKDAKEFNSNRNIDSAFGQIGKTVGYDSLMRELRNANSIRAKFLRSKGITVEPKFKKDWQFNRLSREAMEKLRPEVKAWYEAGYYPESPEFDVLAKKYKEIYLQENKPKTELMRRVADRVSNLKYGDAMNIYRDLFENTGEDIFDELATRDDIDQKLSGYYGEFQDYLDGIVNQLVSEPTLQVGRKFVPYTIDNIVEYMTKARSAKNQEHNITFGFGETRAQASTKFKNLEQMRKHAGQFIVDSDEKYKEMREDASEKASDFRKLVSGTLAHEDIDGWAKYDDAMRSLADFASSKKLDEASLSKALKKNGFKFSALPSELFEVAKEAADALVKTPVPYFEAKPQRAVSLNEFAGAVIPANASEETRAILEKNGIPYVEYDGKENRNQVVRGFSKDLSQGGADTLFQRQENPRGATRISRDENGIAQQMNIELFEKANFSTFSHESAHYMLEVMAKLVAENRASKYMIGEFESIMKYLGTTKEEWYQISGDEKTKLHEKFAQSFEKYLMEGKAPSEELRGAFQRFKDWLVNIYVVIRNGIKTDRLGHINLNEEIRSVFDRMLATDEQIELASKTDGVRSFIATAENLGLSEEEFESYTKIVSKENGIAQDKLRAKAMKAEVRKRQKQYKDELRKARKEAEKEWKESEFVQHIDMFTGEDRSQALNKAQLVSIYGESFVKKLPRRNGRPVYDENGTNNIQEFAEDYGYESSDALIRAIAQMRSPKEWIDNRAKEIVADYFGDELNSVEASEAVDDALNNEMKETRLRTEMKLLRNVVRASEVGKKAERKKQRALLKEKLEEHKQELKAKHQQEIEELKHKIEEEKVKNRWDIAEARKNEEERVVKLREKHQRAIDAINQKIEAQREARREAREYERETNNMLEALKRAAVDGVRRRKAKDISPRQYLNAMRKWSGRARQALNKAKPDYARAAECKRMELICYYQFNEASKLQKKMRSGLTSISKILRRPVKDMKNKTMEYVYHAKALAARLLGRNYEIWDDRIATEEKYGKGIGVDYSEVGNIRDINIEDALVYIEDVKAYMDMANRDGMIEVNGKMVSIEKAEEEAIDEMIAHGESTFKPNRHPSFSKRVTNFLSNYTSSMIRMEHWCDMLGNSQVGQMAGAWTRYIFRPIKQACEKARLDQIKYTRALGEIINGFDFTKQDIDAKELGFVFGKDTGYGKAELIHAILHTGNKSNLERLIVGRGWGIKNEDGSIDTSRWDAFMKRMMDDGVITEEDMDRVQQIWDLFEQLKPESQKAHKAVYGRYFDEISADSFEMFGKQYAGGYVPAIYDPHLSTTGDTQEFSAENMLDVNGSMLPALEARWGNSRVQNFSAPLLLDMSALRNHLNDQILFANVAPASKDVAKLLARKKMRDAMKQYHPDFYSKVVVPWMTRAVTQNVNPSEQRTTMESWINKIRSRAGIAIMFGNVVNAVEGFFDLTAAFAKVKGSHLTSAFKEMAFNRKATIEHVMNASTYMKQRLHSEANAANELFDQSLKPSRLKKVDNWINDHAYFMQEMVDNFTAPVVWLGAYNQALEGNLSEDEAIAQADSTVRSIFGTNNAEDLANWESGSMWKRLFTQFTGYFVNRANMIASQASKINRREDGNRTASLAFLAIMSAFLPAWIGAVIRRVAAGGGEEDETFGAMLMDIFGWSTMSYLFAMGGTAGQFANAGMDYLKGGNMNSGRIMYSPATKAIEDLIKFRKWKDKNTGEINKKNIVRDLADIELAVPFLPVIPTKLLNSGAYVGGVATGSISPTGAVDFVRGALTGRASAGTEKK